MIGSAMKRRDESDQRGIETIGRRGLPGFHILDESDQRGIETAAIAQRRAEAALDESDQRGIETSDDLHKRHVVARMNRTNVELKLEFLERHIDRRRKDESDQRGIETIFESHQPEPSMG